MSNHNFFEHLWHVLLLSPVLTLLLFLFEEYDRAMLECRLVVACPAITHTTFVLFDAVLAIQYRTLTTFVLKEVGELEGQPILWLTTFSALPLHYKYAVAIPN